MNKKIFSSAVFLLIFSLTGSVVLAEHKNTLPANTYRALLRAQVMQPATPAISKKKKGSGIVKRVNQLMHDGPNSFWRKWEELNLWRDGQPDEEELQEGLSLVNDILSQILALTPTTKKEIKEVARATKELNKEKRNLEEHFFRINKMEPLRDMVQDAHDMDEDWGDPSTIAAKLGKFKEIAATLADLAKEASPYRQLAREVKNEQQNIAETIRNLTENLTNAQNNAQQEQERNQNHKSSYLPEESTFSQAEKPILTQKTSNAFRQLTETPGFDKIVKNLYTVNTPVACANVSFDDCGSVMLSIARSGGDLMPFANLIVQAARQIGRSDVTNEQIIEEFQRVAQQQASVYQILRQRAKTR